MGDSLGAAVQAPPARFVCSPQGKSLGRASECSSLLPTSPKRELGGENTSTKMTAGFDALLAASDVGSSYYRSSSGIAASSCDSGAGIRMTNIAFSLFDGYLS